MCANFKPLTYSQLQALNLPPIPFEYLDEVYPAYTTPLLFKSEPYRVCRRLFYLS